MYVTWYYRYVCWVNVLCNLVKIDSFRGSSYCLMGNMPKHGPLLMPSYGLLSLCVQAQYSLLCRSTEWELLEVCKREGVAMLPWSPLKGYTHMHKWTQTHMSTLTSPPLSSWIALRGLLTGKFERGVMPDDPSSSRVAWVVAEQSRTNQSHPSLSMYADKDEFWELLDAMKKIATAHGQCFIEQHH